MRFPVFFLSMIFAFSSSGETASDRLIKQNIFFTEIGAEDDLIFRIPVYPEEEWEIRRNVTLPDSQKTIPLQMIHLPTGGEINFILCDELNIEKKRTQRTSLLKRRPDVSAIFVEENTRSTDRAVLSYTARFDEDEKVFHEVYWNQHSHNTAVGIRIVAFIYRNKKNSNEQLFFARSLPIIEQVNLTTPKDALDELLR